MDRVLELIRDINVSPTMDTKSRRIHGLMRYLMINMDSSWDITEILWYKVDQWESEGMSRMKVNQYRAFLKTV